MNRAARPFRNSRLLLTLMLGELPFISRRNLFGGWNQTVPELTTGFRIS
jgi:hypothetical protein